MRTLHHLEASDLDLRVRLFENATVHTLTTHTLAGERPEAFLTVGNTIAATGTRDECLQVALACGYTNIERVDLGGATVLPGFVDPHAHPLMHGQMLSWVDCGPDRARTIPEIVALLREAADQLPAGTPVRGYGYEHRNLAEGRHPHRHELDQVATDREVYLMNASGHGGVVNSYTFSLHGVDEMTPDPAGGKFFRDADGALTGELSDAACNILTGVDGVKVGHHGPNFHLSDEPAELERQLRASLAEFAAAGVTLIGDAQVSNRELSTYLRLGDDLRVRISLYFLSHLLDEIVALGLDRPFGNARLSFAGIKLYADGTLGGWTAYFPEGYLGDPCRTGQLYHEPADYQALVVKAHSAGLQTATHAQSPTAIQMVLDAVAAAQATSPREDARHRIEHCGLPLPEQILRMKDLGIHPVNQSQHHYNWGEGVTDAIGTPGERFNPLGEFERAGVPVTLSSDAPVAAPHPLEAVQAAVTRVTRNGHQLGPDDLRISVDTALRAHTINGARTLGRESDLGSLEVGKRADFVVLDADPYAVPPEQIASIQVLETWVDGDRIHRNDRALVAATT
jgi:predicted amidohydrolase YtcJ